MPRAVCSPSPAPINGAGSFTIETGATLAFTGSNSLPVTFDGTDATLKLDSASSFSGTINNFAGGDTIDLPGITLSAVSYVGGNLIGTLAAGGTISLSAPGIDTGLQLELGTDAAGASTIYLQPSPVYRGSRPADDARPEQQPRAARRACLRARTPIRSWRSKTRRPPQPTA